MKACLVPAVGYSGPLALTFLYPCCLHVDALYFTL